MSAKRIDPHARFLAAVEYDTNGGCWLWSKGTASNGYGTLWINGRTLSAHRFSWERTYGPVPLSEGYHGTCVLHKCDVRACVNPQHLFLGSMGLNNEDRDAKGRHRAPRGELSGMRKLSYADVEEIKRWRGRASQREIAKLFNISQPNVSLILSGKAWKV